MEEGIIMSNIEKRTFSLPSEHSMFIDGLVTSGAYATASEVVRAGIRALQDREIAIGRWLLEEVAPVYDAMISDPSRAVPAKAVFDDLRTLDEPR